MSQPSFHGLPVLAFESRRATEIAALIRNYGGDPVSAPALREVPIHENQDVVSFVRAFANGEFDVLVTLTGVGLRALLEVADATVGRDRFVAALGRARVAARGPKPLAVLRELGITPWVLAREPNTWRELLEAIDSHGPAVLEGARVAVQEYGVSSPALLEELRGRRAEVVEVAVYRYALPEDLAPLESAVRFIATRGKAVVLFTTASQVAHVLLVAAAMGLDARLRDGLSSCVVASIGPSTSDALVERRITVDLEASPPKMGVLVREAAAAAPALIHARRGGDASNDNPG